MPRYEEFFEILTAFIAWLWGRMLRQQNNEKLPLSEEATQSNETQRIARQGNTKSSPMPHQQNDERPSSSCGNSPEISDIRNSQVSANQVAYAKGSEFSPSFSQSGQDSRSPEAQTQPDPANNSNIEQNLTVQEATQSNEAQQTARQGNNQSGPMPRRLNDERPSSSHGNSPRIYGITDSQVSANQVAVAEGSTFSPSFNCSKPDSKSPNPTR